MSNRTVSLGNGRLFLTLDAAAEARDLYHPHAGFPNHLMGGLCRMGLQLLDDTRVHWVDATWAKEQTIDSDGRGARTLLQCPTHDVALTIHDRLSSEHNCWRREVRAASSHTPSIRLLFHHRLNLGGGDIGGCVRYHPPTHLMHFNRSQHCTVSIDNAPLTDWTLGRSDDEIGENIDAEALLGNRIAMGATDSLVSHRLTLDDAQSDTMFLRLSFGSTSDESGQGRTAPEAHFDITPSGTALSEIPEEFQPLAEASLGVLLSHIDSDGGIVAGLDGSQTPSSRDGYSYVWMRDAALIADVLGRVGQSDAVSNLIRFATRTMSEGGHLLQRHHPDGYAGSTWHPEPEIGSDHLPIQSDETALCVWLAARHIERGHADDGGEAVFGELITPMAEFLHRYRDPKSALPLPSHDLWEERWGIHTFTATVTADALQRASLTAEALGITDDRSDRWAAAATAMKTAIRSRLFHEDTGRYARRAMIEQDGSLFLDTVPDASLLLAALIESAGPITDTAWLKTIDSVVREIAVPECDGGLARYVGDHYARSPQLPGHIAGNPWPMITCWLAEIHSYCDEQEDAAERLREAMKMTTNSGTLSEQVDPLTRLPCSISPLPWSHAAFLSAAIRLSQ